MYINKGKITNNYLEAITLFWDEHCAAIFDKYDSHPWRESRYFNEGCDMCLKYYLRVIEHVYKRFSKKKVLPGFPSFMSFDELKMIVNLMEIP